MNRSGDPRQHDAALARMRMQADPPADAAVARIVGDWAVLPPDADAQQLRDAHQAQWERLQQATGLLQQLGDNAGLADWRAEAPDVDPAIVQAVEAFVHAEQALPPWADPERLQRAEALFIEHGPLSCILLFCAGLPACYQMPSLARVLQTTGQLTQHTLYRIRSTAAMAFPVMMQGGLAGGAGTGRAQILKVRLIHATVRNLILHGNPSGFAQGPAAAPVAAGAAAVVPGHAALQGQAAGSMPAALFGAGWDVGRDGLPCNQEELAYTLLTFGYVFLRGLRQLGIACSRDDEEAVLHTWNVAAAVLGVRREAMAWTMDEARDLFTRMQRRAHATPAARDARHALGQTLMRAMEDTIAWSVCKPMPVLMTTYLCGEHNARAIGVDRRAPLPARVLFGLGMDLTRAFDTVMRLRWPNFSLCRLFTRVLGYRLVTRLLMDQTRSLRLPTQLLAQAGAMLDDWGADPLAPDWINTLEDRLTVKGSWRA